MFIISQYLLNNLSSTDLEYTSIYAIAIGLVVYACIYLYFLFYNEEFLSIFNKFIIYIIGIDLLLSSFYYAHNKNSLEYKQVKNSDNISDNISDETDDINDVDINDDDDFEDHIHTEINTEDYDEFNIESDVESNLPVPVDDKVQENVEENAVLTIPSFNAVEDLDLDLDVKLPDDLQSASALQDNLEETEVVLTKKRRGRKPNSKVHNSDF
jgi:hypothetical protein